MESSFYQNVFLLTEAVPPSKEFLKYFKEGMFDKPNTVGFMHVSQYLLTIYDAERSKRLLKWPLFCKKEEVDYRTIVKDFLASVARENPDIPFPQILASHLLHASGTKFSTIMWNLSTVCLRTYLRRKIGFELLAPKIKVAKDLSRILLNNVISRSEQNIKKLDTQMNTAEEVAKKFACQIAESIKKIQEDLLLTRQNLIDLAPQAPVHPAMKSHLADPNDLKVMRIWQKCIEESLAYLKSKQKRLDEITELSNSIAAIVTSIATADLNMLDGNLLPKIETNALSKIDGLDPETQVILHRLHVNSVLSLENLLELFIRFLLDYHRCLEKNGVPDLSPCEEQVHASCEDMKSMTPLFKTLCERMVTITTQIENIPTNENNHNAQKDMLAGDGNNDIFDSVLLKPSPTININRNHESERTDVNDRLDLTPVENMHKALFARHRRMEDNTHTTKLRPKLIIPRINLEDTSVSCISEKILSPVNRSTTSRMLNQSMTQRSGKYSHLFSFYQKKNVNRSNLNMTSASGLSRNNTIVNTRTSTDLYNISELRPHITVQKDKFMESLNVSTPIKFTPKKRNTKLHSSTINDDAKSLVKMISQPVIDEKTELKIEVQRSPKSRQADKSKDRNKRTSISDLVERYKRVRENKVDKLVNSETSSDASDESVKH